MSDAPLPIEPEQVGRFSIDSKNNLYWDNQLIQTESVLKLSGGQTLLARAVTVAALMGSLATVANATASWLTYLSKSAQNRSGTQPLAPPPSATPAVTPAAKP